MHVLAGVTVMLGYLSVRDFLPWFPREFSKFIPALVFVLAVAVTWEYYEVLIGIPTSELNYVADTVTDLAMGIVGGLLGYFIGQRVSRRNRI